MGENRYLTLENVYVRLWFFLTPTVKKRTIKLHNMQSILEGSEDSAFRFPILICDSRQIGRRKAGSMSKHSPNGKWEKEFYSSQLYKMLNQVKTEDVENTVRKAVNVAGNTVRRAEEVVQEAVSGKKQTSDTPESFHPGQTPPPSGTTPGSFHPGQPPVGRTNTGNPQSNANPYDTRNRNPYSSRGTGGYQYGTKNEKRKKKEQVPEGMRRVRRPGIAKFYITGVFCLLYALIFPMYRWFDFLVFAVLGVLIYWVSSKLFKGKWILEPIPEEPKPEPKSSGNPEVDKVVQEGTEYLRRLHKADENIEDEEISAAIVRMEEISFRIFAYICDHPNKVGQIRKFMNYYLPTTLKLLDSYDRMSRQDVQGENITQSMVEIERIMQTIVLAFEKQLDALFQDEAMDISTDITVLEGMMAQEGISSQEEKGEGEGPSLKL